VELGLEKATTRAINKTLKNGARITAQMVSEEFGNVRQKEVIDQLHIRRATYSKPVGELNFVGRGSLPLLRYVVGGIEPVPTMPKYFKTPEAERVKGVRVKVKKATGITTLGGAFLAEMESGHVGVFEREDPEDHESPIKEMYSTSWLKWLETDLVEDELEEQVSERFEQHIEHEARYVLMQAGLR